MRLRFVRDNGFTLVEVIIVVSVLAILMSVLAASITVFLRNEGSVSERLTKSRDLQNLTNHLPGDVASSRLVQSDMDPSPLSAVTSTAACGTTGDILLHLEWSEFWTSDYSASVTYRVTPSAIDPEVITRYLCENSDPVSAIDVASSFSAVAIELERVGSDLTGTVDLRLTYDDGEFKRITGTSRHFLPTP